MATYCGQRQATTVVEGPSYLFNGHHEFWACRDLIAAPCHVGKAGQPHVDAYVFLAQVLGDGAVSSAGVERAFAQVQD